MSADGDTVAASTESKMLRQRVSLAIPHPTKKNAFAKPVLQKAGFNATYVVSEGFRHVVPYTFSYLVYAKKRWMNRELLDVLKSEYKTWDPEYFKRAIADGRILVNGVSQQPSYVFLNADLLEHCVHRHEPPVVAVKVPEGLPLEIIHEDTTVIVVNKPASVPVHECGKYYHNSVVGILRSSHVSEHGLVDVYPIHRLDRLTSGVLMFGKSSSIASQLQTQIQNNEMHKVYIARVLGEFPAEEITVTAPVMEVDRKKSRHVVHENGKYAETKFKRLHYNGITSLVECRPVTGRTHQIRLHLQHLGHPIANDIIYGGKLLPSSAAKHDQHPSPGEPYPDCDECLQNPYYRSCYHATSIWLHAYQYSSSSFSYTAPLPAWATEEFNCMANSPISENSEAIST